MNLPATPWHVLRERWSSVKQSPAHETPLSPCMSICTMNDSTVECAGCLRTLDEIAHWSMYSPLQQRQVWQRIGSILDSNAGKL